MPYYLWVSKATFTLSQMTDDEAWQINHSNIHSGTVLHCEKGSKMAVIMVLWPKKTWDKSLTASCDCCYDPCLPTNLWKCQHNTFVFFRYINAAIAKTHFLPVASSCIDCWCALMRRCARWWRFTDLHHSQQFSGCCRTVYIPQTWCYSRVY